MFMPVSASRSVAVAEVGLFTWEVREGAAVMGYIHRAGNVFVSLAGGNLHFAVEVAQSLTPARALEALGIRKAAAETVRLA